MTEERIQYLLAMALEVRTAARAMRYPEARYQMTEMAQRFERLAHHYDPDDVDDELLLDGVFAEWSHRRAARL